MVLFAAGLLFWASLASLLPTLSLYIKDVGATEHQVGIVMGAFAIGLLLFRPPVARMADQRGRKIVLLIGVAAVAIAPLGYLLTQSIPLLMLIRTFHGLSIAAFTTGYSALVVDLSPEHKRGELIGYMTLVNPLGVAIGPAIGGLLQEWAGYTPLFLAAAVLGVASFVCTLWVPASPVQPVQPAQESKTQPEFWQLVLTPRLRVPTLVMLMVGLAFGVLSTFVPLFIKQTGVNFNAGLFYTAAAVASFGVRLLTGRASDLHGRGRFITVSLLFYTAAMLLLYTANSAIAFLVAGLIEGAGAGMLLPTIIALVSDRSGADERGRVFGLTMAGFDLGMAIAGPTLGYFAISLGYRGLFGLAGILTFLSFIVFICQSNKTLSQSLKFALGSGRDLHALPQTMRG
jgi:MFS family permease